MTTQSTPGPWNVYHFVGLDENKATECGLYEIQEANEQINDLLHDGEIVEAVALAKSNARLIAAAPDLLEALENLSELIRKYPDRFGAREVNMHQYLIVSDDALDKAKGNGE